MQPAAAAGLRAVLLCLALLLARPVPAWAHAGLIASDPPDQAVLSSPPAELTLVFDEPVEPLAMRLVDAQGRSSDVTAIAQHGAQLALTPPMPLVSGVYVLNWRVASADGHPVGGSLVFWIGARDAAAQVATAVHPALAAVIWITRVVMEIGLLVGIGGAFYLAWFARVTAREAKRVAITAIIAGFGAVGFSIGLQGLDALGQSFAGLVDPAVWRAGARGPFGASSAIAGAALLVGLIALGAGGRIARSCSLTALIGIGAALAVSGHTATAEPRAAALAAMLLHGASLAVWVGALVPLAFSLRQPGANHGLRRFSRAIPFAVVALLGSGLALTTMQLGAIDALWRTAYGQVLAVKLALVLALLALATWNRLGLTPRLDRPEARRLMRGSIAAEIALVVTILGVVGLWRFTPPPRLHPPEPAEVSVHLHDQGVMANATVSPARPGMVAITVSVRKADGAPLEAKGVQVTLVQPELGIAMAAVEARGDQGRWQATVTVPVPGQWRLGLGILVSDFERVRLDGSVTIR